jgi:dihydrofolate reductase
VAAAFVSGGDNEHEPDRLKELVQSLPAMTREVRFGGAVSLDGYFAGPGEAIDWIRWSDESAALSAASWKGVDAMLMGRRTFEFAMRVGGGLGVGPKIRTYVFSRTLAEVPEGSELVGEDAAEFVRRLKESEGGVILVMGGGELGSALIEAGLVDEIGLTVHPLLLGGGIPPSGRWRSGPSSSWSRRGRWRRAACCCATGRRADASAAGTSPTLPIIRAPKLSRRD